MNEHTNVFSFKQNDKIMSVRIFCFPVSKETLRIFPQRGLFCLYTNGQNRKTKKYSFFFVQMTIFIRNKKCACHIKEKV